MSSLKRTLLMGTAQTAISYFATWIVLRGSFRNILYQPFVHASGSDKDAAFHDHDPGADEAVRPAAGAKAQTFALLENS